MGSTHAIYFSALYLLGTAFPGYLMWPILFTHISALEYVDVSKRSLIANLMIALGQTFAGCVGPWILKALGDWKPFFLINAAPVALIFITPLYLAFFRICWGSISSHQLPLSLQFCLRISTLACLTRKCNQSCEDYQDYCQGKWQKSHWWHLWKLWGNTIFHIFATWQNDIHSQRFAISHREKCKLEEKKNVLTLFKSRRLRNHTILTIIAW